jgi:hypothetical protein
MPPQPLLGVGPDGRSWPREQRGSVLGAAVVLMLVGVVVTIAGVVLQAPIVALGGAALAVYRVVALLASLPAALTPWIIQVGRDGVWLPELGYRRWADFSSIRLETYRAEGAEPGWSPHLQATRRLGFDLRTDAAPGPNRLAELRADLRLGWYRLALRLGGAAPAQPGRYAIREANLGAATFDAVVAAVGREVPVVAVTPVAVPSPDDLGTLRVLTRERRTRWAAWGVLALFLLIVLGTVLFSKPVVGVVPVEATPVASLSRSGSSPGP